MKREVIATMVMEHHLSECHACTLVGLSRGRGRSLKFLTVADDFTHECAQMAVDFGMGASYVTRLPEEAAQFRGYPQAVRTDNGPEFIAKAFLAWTQLHQITHILIQPGCPTQNAYIESFNGTFRDECLNEHWFTSLAEARAESARWRRDYNEVRPHSSIGRIPPAKFATQHRQLTADAAREASSITHSTPETIG